MGSLGEIYVLLSLALLSIIPKCYGEDLQPHVDINKYLFDEHSFQLIDLTINLDKQIHRLSEGERTSIQELHRDQRGLQSCEEWSGTSLKFGLKGQSSPRKSIDEIPIEKLILPLIIADVSSQVSDDQNFLLHKHHLDFFLNNYFGKTEQPCLIVFKFGWSKNKHDIRKYYGLIDADNSTQRTPGISEEVAKWITTAYKNVVGVGVDLPSVDPLSTTDNYYAHNTFVDAGVYVVDNVDLDEYLPDAWCTAVLLPQKSHEAQAPARLVAVCPKSRMEPHKMLWHQI